MGHTRVVSQIGASACQNRGEFEDAEMANDLDARSLTACPKRPGIFFSRSEKDLDRGSAGC
jgi:hypothetical protein